MKKVLIIPAVIVVLLGGCHPEENPDQLKAVNRSLEYANGVMEEANKLVYEEFGRTKRELHSWVFTAVWEPKAKQIGQYSDSVRLFIRTIKGELLKQSNSLKIDYVDLTKQLHNADGIGGQLLNKLIAFKDSIPAVIYSGDTMSRFYKQDLLNDFLKTVPLLPAYRDSLPADKKIEYKKQWLEKSFGRTSALMAMIMLNKIESDVLATENTFITYCKDQVAIGCNMSYLHVTALAFLSSSYIKPGQSIQVSAGLGTFTSTSKPIITINNSRVPLNDQAVAEYTFKPIGKPGEYSVPVKIEFTKPDGTKDTISKLAKYIIAEN
ncbi:hypothetical protein [Niastella yeongjuensis]|nr:hypothetical protein [Niastella yeongjuensis]SEN39669.1 GldM N-terminal domain-containing protein [Niastella yeongjuensis]